MALTALGQGVYLATAPILGRLYTPEAFGLYGLFYTFVVTAALFICLNYDIAIPAARDDAEAEDLSRGSLIFALLLAPLFGCLAAAFCYWDIAGFGRLPAWSGLIVAGVLLFQALIQIMQSWRVRRQDTLVIGRAGVTLNFVRGGVQVLAGLLGGTWWGLGLGELLGRLGNAVHLGRERPERPGWKPRFDGSLFRPPWTVLRRYRQFPVVLLPSQAMDSVIQFIQIAWLTFLFGPAGLGQYFIMRRTLDLPVAFAFRSLGDVFYARLADHARNAPHHVRPFFVRSFLVLLVLGLIGGAPLMFFGPQIFRLVFGQSWGEAGLLAAVMTPAAVMNLAVAPASRVFALTRRPGLRYVFTLCSLVGTVLVLGAGWRCNLDLVGVTAGLSAVVSLSYFAYFLAGVVAAGDLIAMEGQAEPV